MTHVDLCTGIGGFTLAAQDAGFKTLCVCENDPWKKTFLANKFPHLPNEHSLEQFRIPNYVKPTLITAGFPCQPQSLSGDRNWAADPRWLWPRVLEIYVKTGASWLVCENVFGLVSLGLDEIYADLEAHGYSCQAFCIPASAVGHYHERYRVWLVAHPNRAGFEGLSLPRTSNAFPAQPQISVPSDVVFTTRTQYLTDSKLILPSDGISVQVAKDEVSAFGDALVPQIAVVLLSIIATIEQAKNALPSSPPAA